MTRSGVIAGTPDYMSPEQARGLPVDHRTDLFSLGSVIYAMATGHPPFRAENTMAVLNRICHESPRPLCDVQSDLPQWFEELVQRLLAKEPEQRYANATQAADVLAQCLAHLQQPASVPLPNDLRPAESPTDLLTQHPASRAGWLGPATFSLITVAGLLLLATLPGWLKPTAGEPWIAPPAVAPADSQVPLEWHDQFDTEMTEMDEQLRQLEADQDAFPISTGPW